MEATSIIGAVASAVLTPISGLLTLYINRKFDAMDKAFSANIADLHRRLAECEDRHKRADAAKQPSREPT